MDTFVMCRCSAEQARDIAGRVQAHVDRLQSHITLLLEFTSGSEASGGWSMLRLAGMENEDEVLVNVPASLEWIIAKAGSASETLEQALSLTDVLLAELCSAVAGEAWFLALSDTLCCSAGLYFSQGRIRGGTAYGFQGSDLFIEIEDESIAISSKELGSGFDYTEPRENARRTIFATHAPPALEDEDAEIRFTIVSKSSPVEPIKQKVTKTANFYTTENVAHWKKVGHEQLETLIEWMLAGDWRGGQVWDGFCKAHEGLAEAAIAERRFADARMHLHIAAEAAMELMRDRKAGYEIEDWRIRWWYLPGAAWNALIAGAMETYDYIRALQEELFPGQDPSGSTVDALVHGDMNAARIALDHQGSQDSHAYPFLRAIVDRDEEKLQKLLLANVSDWRQRIISEGLRGYSDAVAEWRSVGWLILAERAWGTAPDSPSPLIPADIIRAGQTPCEKAEYRPWAVMELYVPGPEYRESLRIAVLDPKPAYRVGDYVTLRVFVQSKGWVCVPTAESGSAPMRRLAPPSEAEQEFTGEGRPYLGVRLKIEPPKLALPDSGRNGQPEVQFRRSGVATVRAEAKPYFTVLESNVLTLQGIESVVESGGEPSDRPW